MFELWTRKLPKVVKSGYIGYSPVQMMKKHTTYNFNVGLFAFSPQPKIKVHAIISNSSRLSSEITLFLCNYATRLISAGWWRGVVVRGVRYMNEVNRRQARLVLGRVTVFGLVYHLRM